MEKQSLFKNARGINYLYPFITIAMLYLLWGLAHGMLDVLNKHFQDTFDMTKAESGFVQFAMYMGYFIMSAPAGIILHKLGYKWGIISGLLLFAFGALLFVPASFLGSPYPFLCALFILACGLCVIETGAHPCATSMGPEEHAARRINIAAAFNGVGWIFGPLLGTALILDGSGGEFDIAIPYIIVALVVLLVTLIFSFQKVPEKEMEHDLELAHTEDDGEESGRSLLKNNMFVVALIAQFLYVGAQTGINSFFINYAIETEPDMSAQTAGYLLSFGGMGMFLAGRLFCGYTMLWVRPARMLSLFASLATLCMVLVVLQVETLSFFGLFCCYFFMAPMFPTIFALGVKGLGKRTKKASSLLVCCIVGGAVFPFFMGLIGKDDMALGFILPLLAFAVISLYGIISESKAWGKQ